MGKLLEQRNRALDDINAGRTVKKIRDLESRVRELEEESARLKVMEESALKVCGQLDEVVIALPYDYLDSPDGGDVSLGEQVKRMYSEVKTLRHAVVASQAYAEQLRKALGKFRDDVLFRIGCSSPYRNVAKEYFEYIRPILSLPTDTRALDAYVSEKVKEIIESHAPDGRNVTNAQHVEMRHKFVEQIATLTRQRDLAVEAMREALECGEDGDWQSARRILASVIKESEQP